MNTPNTIKEKFGLSTDMARYYVKGYYSSLGESIKYSSQMELNGSYIPIVKFILSKTKDESVRKVARKELSGIPVPSISQLRNGTNERNERNRTEQDERIREIQLRNEAERNEWNEERDELNNVIEERERQRKLLAEQANALAAQNDELEKTIQLMEQAENERLAKAKAWSKDIGEFVLSSPNVKFVSMVIILFAQAFLFASLEEKVLDGMGMHIPFVAAFIVGVLFEACGFMIARHFPPRNKFQDLAPRDGWLFLFLFIQLVTNSCLVEFWTAETWAILIGRILVASVPPIGLMAYSYLYLRSNNNE